MVKQRHSYSFITDTITFKSVIEKGVKRRYVTGYISTTEVDLYNDIVTPNALKSMLRQIQNKTIVLDYEHESWRDNPTILPVGKIVEAKVDDRGLWVKAELNPYSPKFKSMWNSIKEGVIQAFSIAFKPLKTITKTIGDTEVRLIEDLELLNVALTGTPVNRSATMTSFGMKDVMLKAIGDMEKDKTKEDKMNEETKKKEELELKNKELAEKKAEEEKIEAEKKAKALKEKEDEEKKKKEIEKKSENDLKMEKMTEELKAITEKQKEAEAELKAFKESDVFKSLTPKKPETKAVEKGVLESIK